MANLAMNTAEHGCTGQPLDSSRQNFLLGDFRTSTIGGQGEMARHPFNPRS